MELINTFISEVNNIPTLKLKPASVIKANLGLGNGGPAHKFFTDTCYKHMDRFVPKRNNNLRKIVAYGIEGTTIIYLQEYASYQYYGQRRDGTHKVKNYTTAGTGPYWDKRMWSVDKDKIIKEVQLYIDKYGGS